MAALTLIVLLCLGSSLLPQTIETAAVNKESSGNNEDANPAPSESEANAQPPVDCNTNCENKCKTKPVECEFIADTIPINCGSKKDMCLSGCADYCSCLTTCSCGDVDGCGDDCSKECFKNKIGDDPLPTTTVTTTTVAAKEEEDVETNTGPLPVVYHSGTNKPPEEQAGTDKPEQPVASV